VLKHLLPAGVAVSTSRGDIPPASPFPEEEALVRDAVEKRRSEFATARTCARRALAELGIAPRAILRGADGAPLWPPGVIGSITHCDGYRACAVAWASDLLAIGIDAEPNEPLPSGLIGDIALARELVWLERLRWERPEVQWDRLLFCMKEAIYKAWAPRGGRDLGFDDATVEVGASNGTFSARLRRRDADDPTEAVTVLRGRWAVSGGIAMAAVAVSHPPRMVFGGSRRC
jgi:4'-phosphopantetheinyl transferase EntD